MDMRIHKAISIIQFKLEGQLVRRRPEYHMEDRDLLSRIDFDTMKVEVDGKYYDLLDKNLPTVDPADPNRLSPEEEYVMERLQSAFMNCRRLQEHMQLLLRKGALYNVINGNLLYHGCVPMTEDGDFKEVEIYGKKYRGKSLYDCLDALVRRAFFAVDPVRKEEGRDIMWWIWCNKDSPLFGKDKMATFERCMIAEKETHSEGKTPYYQLLDDKDVIEKILREFGLEGEHTHIINGHVPVKRGQSPTKCGGKLLIIDGGFSKAYQGTTGIAGYTLIYNSWGMRLVAHEPFTSKEDAVLTGRDIHSDKVAVEKFQTRQTIGDTDIGIKLKAEIEELEQLLAAYRSGELVEKR